jgi:hypothetical protein
VAKFLYLFENNEAYGKVSSERMQQLTKMWWTWMEDMKKGGHLVQAGERMDSTGKVVRGKAKTVTDGPCAEPDRAAVLKSMLHAWRQSVNARMTEPNPAYSP